MYNKFFKNGNMTYSIDKLRLKTYITYSTFSEIEFRFQTVWREYVKKSYITGRLSEYKYNYNIEIGEGVSFFFGFFHNTEKTNSSEFAKYSFCIEFNPNKLKDNKIVFYLLCCSGDWYIRSYDLAVDIETNILNLIIDKSGKRMLHIFSAGFDDKTYTAGKNDGRFKVYNKKKESNLDIKGDLTRVEVSRCLEDYPINRINLYKYNDVFPEIYLNNYVMRMDDYASQTLLVHIYALQNGYPLANMSRGYKNKIKKLLEGGYRVKFYNKYAEQVLQQTIYFYFVRNPLVRWDKIK